MRRAHFNDVINLCGTHQFLLQVANHRCQTIFDDLIAQMLWRNRAQDTRTCLGRVNGLCRWHHQMTVSRCQMHHASWLKNWYRTLNVLIKPDKPGRWNGTVFVLNVSRIPIKPIAKRVGNTIAIEKIDTCNHIDRIAIPAANQRAPCRCDGQVDFTAWQ